MRSMVWTSSSWVHWRSCYSGTLKSLWSSRSFTITSHAHTCYTFANLTFIFTESWSTWSSLLLVLRIRVLSRITRLMRVNFINSFFLLFARKSEVFEIFNSFLLNFFDIIRNPSGYENIILRVRIQLIWSMVSWKKKKVDCKT